ncbi:MAG: type VI secretion system-associated FHA domain protein TagH [Pikeienuella sp.]
MGLTLTPTGSGTIPGEMGPIQMSDGVITIGRGEDNDLTLPDPERHISKRHCVIEQRGNDFFLLDVSTNGTFLNHAPDRVGEQPMPLNDGDVICLGFYELRVSIGSAADPFAAPEDPLDALPPPAEQTSITSAIGQGHARHAPNEELEDPLAGDDDLLGILGQPPGAEAPRGPGPLPDGLGPGGDLLPQRDSAQRHDPLAGPDGRELMGDPMGRDERLDLAGDPLAPAPDGEDDWLSGAGATPRSDHVPDHRAHFAPPTPRPPAATGPGGRPLLPENWDLDEDEDEPAASDPLADLGGTPSASASAPAPAAPRDAARPAAAQHPSQPGAVSASAAGSAGSGGDAARAFLRAAGGGAVPVSDAELEETMARLGAAFGIMVSGMREVLMTRKSIKDEFRLSQTQIQAGGNNPLKFSVSPEQAIGALIRPAVPGYLPADAAAKEALKDIKAHEIAVITGMQAALKAILVRLDPAALVARLEREGGLLDMLSGKKARYWEVYEELYGQISREAEDDFQTLFGREFARAYEEQLKKL